MLNIISFKEVLEKQIPNYKKTNFLLACSAGLDSTVLFYLFKDVEINFSVAHINYNLRDSDSIKDAQFVKELAQRHHIRYFEKSFDTLENKPSQVSLQMYCRSLRYSYFEDIQSELNYDYLVTAHHKNDAQESFFLQNFRGNKSVNIVGMKILRNNRFKPLLNFYKTEIESYAKSNGIAWREDQSNSKNTYLRNFIRNEMIPSLKKEIPNFESKLQISIENLNEIQTYLEKQIDIKKQLFIQKEDVLEVKIEDLQKLENFMLNALFTPYGFIYTKEIQKIFEAKNNSQFESITHTIIKNRAYIYIQKKEKEIKKTEVFTFTQKEIDILKPLKIKTYLSKQKDEKANYWVDADLLTLPIFVRNIKADDIFYPIGMQGSKKVSKFLKDLKIAKHLKKNIWLLENSDKKIISILGFRQDRRFQINKDTQNILNIYL